MLESVGTGIQTQGAALSILPHRWCLGQGPCSAFRQTDAPKVRPFPPSVLVRPAASVWALRARSRGRAALPPGVPVSLCPASWVAAVRAFQPCSPSFGCSGWGGGGSGEGSSCPGSAVEASGAGRLDLHQHRCCWKPSLESSEQNER